MVWFHQVLLENRILIGVFVPAAGSLFCKLLILAVSIQTKPTLQFTAQRQINYYTDSN